MRDYWYKEGYKRFPQFEEEHEAWRDLRDHLPPEKEDSWIFAEEMANLKHSDDLLTDYNPLRRRFCMGFAHARMEIRDTGVKKHSDS